MSLKTALLIIDMQNDICHQDGIFSKNGLASSSIFTIIPNLTDVISFCKKVSVPVISIRLTVFEDVHHRPAGLKNMQKLYPFLTKEGCREATWGHEIIETLPKPDYSVRKWTLSAFYQTELEYILQALEIDSLLIGGFATNGSVETLARDAFSRNYAVTTLSDCVASYSESLHQSSLVNLQIYGKILPWKAWQNQYEQQMVPS